MKKIISLFLVVVMLLTTLVVFASCGDKEDGADGSSKVKVYETYDLTSEKYAFAVAKENTALKTAANELLAELKANGELDKIINSFFDGSATFTYANPVSSVPTGADRENYLIVATNAYFPPFEYYEGDKLSGVDMKIASLLAEKLGKTLSRSERHRYRDYRLIVFYGIVKCRFFERSYIGIKEPERALGKDVQPSSAFHYAVYVLLECEHRAPVVFGNRHSSKDTHKCVESALKVRLPCGEIAYMRTYRLKHGEVVPHKYVVGDGDSTVFKLFFVLFQIFPSVYPESVCQVHKRKDHDVQNGGGERALDTEHSASRHIFVIFVKLYLAGAFKLKHMRVAALGVLIA